MEEYCSKVLARYGRRRLEGLVYKYPLRFFNRFSSLSQRLHDLELVREWFETSISLRSHSWMHISGKDNVIGNGVGIFTAVTTPPPHSTLVSVETSERAVRSTEKLNRVFRSNNAFRKLWSFP